MFFLANSVMTYFTRAQYSLKCNVDRNGDLAYSALISYALFCKHIIVLYSNLLSSYSNRAILVRVQRLGWLSLNVFCFSAQGRQSALFAIQKALKSRIVHEFLSDRFVLNEVNMNLNLNSWGQAACQLSLFFTCLILVCSRKNLHELSKIFVEHVLG